MVRLYAREMLVDVGLLSVLSIVREHLDRNRFVLAKTNEMRLAAMSDDPLEVSSQPNG
jgi:hypothetical protein